MGSLRKNTEKLILWSLYVCLGIHIILTTVGYFSNERTTWGSFRLKSYTDVIFFQKWNFFAPIPGIVMEKIQITCDSDQAFGSLEIDPALEILDRSVYVPFHIDYKKTYGIRDLTLGLIKSTTQFAEDLCKEADVGPTERFSGSSLEHPDLVPLMNKEFIICPRAIEKARKTSEYRRVLAMSKTFCAQKFPSLAKTGFRHLQFRVVQEYPFPIDQKDLREKSPSFKTSQIAF